MTQMTTQPVPTQTPRRRTLRLALLVLAGIGILGGALATRAAAEEHVRGAFMRRMVSARIDAALDAAKVNDRQRDAIHASRDRVFDEVARARRGHADLDQALQLFEADRLDRERVRALRQGHEANFKRIGDAVEQALAEAHDVLTPAQRRAVADYVRNHRRDHHQK